MPMRDLDPLLEARFFSLLQAYFDLERDTARTYGHGEYTLERMAVLARIAGNPEQKLRIIHVAGTKGKGSTCFFIGALLEAAGRSSGVYSSPHLATVRERFLTHGRLIPYAALLTEAAALKERIEREGVRPTLFEVFTVLGLRLFAQAGCEFAVVEAGIGGLLDATNYVPAPECCVITSISYDHTQLLGNSISEIARQKAGIIKQGVPVVCADQRFPEAGEVLAAAARSRQARVYPPAAADACARWALGALPAFLRDNFRTALRVLEVLGIPASPTLFRLPALPARFERIRQTPPVVLDAAHNADSAAQLAAALLAAYPGVGFTTVLGIVAGKDVEGILAALRPVTRHFIFTNPRSSYKGSELAKLISLGTAAGVAFRVIPEIGAAGELPEREPLLFTGSFFTALIGDELFNR